MEVVFLNGFCHWNEQIRSIASFSILRARARPRIQLARTLGVLSIGLRHTQSVLKSVWDPSELDRVLEDDELFKPPTIVTDKWFEIVSSD